MDAAEAEAEATCAEVHVAIEGVAVADACWVRGLAPFTALNRSHATLLHLSTELSELAGLFAWAVCVRIALAEGCAGNAECCRCLAGEAGAYALVVGSVGATCIEAGAVSEGCVVVLNAVSSWEPSVVVDVVFGDGALDRARVDPHSLACGEVGEAEARVTLCACAPRVVGVLDLSGRILRVRDVRLALCGDAAEGAVWKAWDLALVVNAAALCTCAGAALDRTASAADDAALFACAAVDALTVIAVLGVGATCATSAAAAVVTTCLACAVRCAHARARCAVLVDRAYAAAFAADRSARRARGGACVGAVSSCDADAVGIANIASTAGTTATASAVVSAGLACAVAAGCSLVGSAGGVAVSIGLGHIASIVFVTRTGSIARTGSVCSCSVGRCRSGVTAANCRYSEQRRTCCGEKPPSQLNHGRLPLQRGTMRAYP